MGVKIPYSEAMNEKSGLEVVTPGSDGLVISLRVTQRVCPGDLNGYRIGAAPHQRSDQNPRVYILACRRTRDRPLKPASHGLTPSASLARRPLERVIVAALVLLSACRLCPSRSRLQLLVALPHRPRIGVIGISPASCWRVAQEL